MTFLLQSAVSAQQTRLCTQWQHLQINGCHWYFYSTFYSTFAMSLSHCLYHMQMDEYSHVTHISLLQSTGSHYCNLCLTIPTLYTDIVQGSLDSAPPLFWPFIEQLQGNTIVECWRVLQQLMAVYLDLHSLRRTPNIRMMSWRAMTLPKTVLSLAVAVALIGLFGHVSVDYRISATFPTLLKSFLDGLIFELLSSWRFVLSIPVCV